MNDIEVLEELISLYKNANKLKRNKDLEQIEAEHQRINGELRERVKELENSNENYKKYAVMMSTEGLIINGVIFSFNDYISKSKIKEKIEELEHKGENYIFNEKDNAVRLGKIQVLEELLKGE